MPLDVAAEPRAAEEGLLLELPRRSDDVGGSTARFAAAVDIDASLHRQFFRYRLSLVACRSGSGWNSWEAAGPSVTASAGTVWETGCTCAKGFCAAATAGQRATAAIRGATAERCRGRGNSITGGQAAGLIH